jgi:stage IV sporulation protein FB
MYFKKIIETSLYLLFIIVVSHISHTFFYGLIFIFIHELCHGLCALILGYKIEFIKLIPFGFTSNIKEEFIRPFDDILISLSGPLINLIFFVLLYLVNFYLKLDTVNLKTINIMLFIFNMVPAEFLDGGRILKTLLKIYLNFYIAYIVSIVNGIIMAFLLLFSVIYTKSLLNGIILIVISVYIFFSCYRSKKEIILNIIKDIFLKKKYMKEYTDVHIYIKAFSGDTNLLFIIKYFSFKKYYIIYLMENGTLQNKFNENDIINLYCSKGNIKLKECVKFLNT